MKRPIKENEAPAEAQNLLRSSTEPYKTHQEKPEAERAAHKATEKARLKKSCRERTNAMHTRHHQKSKIQIYLKEKLLHQYVLSWSPLEMVS